MTSEAAQAISDYIEGTSKPAIDSHVTQKQTAFDSHVAEKTSEAEQAISGYVEETSKPAIDSHVAQKQSAFDSHVAEKTEEAEQAISEAKDAALAQIQASMSLGESDYEAL